MDRARLNGVTADPRADAFGRSRVSDPFTLFDSQFEYGKQPLLWEDVVSGTGSVAHSIVSGQITLTTGGAASGARAMRRTKVYHRYNPGKSQLVKLTGIPHSAGSMAGAAESRVGYFDDNDGIFFGIDATGPFWSLRSSVTGAVVEERAYHGDWNLDNVANDVASVMELILDTQREHIVVIDLQWLGVGRVRCGLQINGFLIYCHQFLHANRTVRPYMRTANLPLTYEVVNAGAAGANVSMTQVCGVVESEGGENAAGGIQFCASTKGATVSAANAVALTPILSLRLVDKFGGLTYRGHVLINQLALLVATNPMYWEVLWNPTLTNSTFAGVVDATHSGVQFDLAATAVTGGITMDCGYVASGSGSTRQAAETGVSNRLIMARTYAAGFPDAGGGTRDIITLAARGMGGASTVSAGFNFTERY
jgi:hypothetical protein